MNDFDFDRLFQAMDDLAPTLGEPVVQQIGHSTFVSKNSECFSYKVDGEMQALFDKADLIITHAGVGSILNGLNRNIPLILFPRTILVPIEGFDQQKYVAEKVRDMGRAVVLGSLEELPQKILEARNLKFEPYQKDRSLVTWLDNLLGEISEKKQKKKKIRDLHW